MNTLSAVRLCCFCSFLFRFTGNEADDLDLQGTLENQNGKVVSETVLAIHKWSPSLVYISSLKVQLLGKLGLDQYTIQHQQHMQLSLEPSPTSKKLRRRKIPNTKDFRQIDEIYEYQLPKGALLELASRSAKLFYLMTWFTQKKMIFISQTCGSQETQMAARFMFGVDVVSLIKHNSAFGDMLDNSQEMSTFVSEKTKIKH